MGSSCCTQLHDPASTELSGVSAAKMDPYPAAKHLDSFRTDPGTETAETNPRPYPANELPLQKAPRAQSFVTDIARTESFQTIPQHASFATIIGREGSEAMRGASFHTQRVDSFHTMRKDSFRTIPNSDSFAHPSAVAPARPPRGAESIGNPYPRLDEKALRVHNNELVAQRFAAVRTRQL
mmetsp:Transcript_13172/g.30929  ORF Transcript_13172/g.30929 Transcript_13172/m.30929 type:complete len:181 (-) Transcript_13172:153-695(-)